jgi:general secretion pathway protein L
MAELAGLLPMHWLRAIGLGVDSLTCRRDGHSFALSLDVKGRIEQTQTLALDDFNPIRFASVAKQVLGGRATDRVRSELIIDPALALTCNLQIPHAAQRELAGVLTFEVERHTPYRANEVLFTWNIDRRASSEELLAITLTVVPRNVVMPLVDVMRETGVAANTIRIASTDQNGADMTAAAGMTARPARTLLRTLALTASLLIIAAAAVPYVRQNLTISDLEERIGVARNRVAALASVSDNAARLENASRIVVDAKLSKPSVARILETLSATLPDGTWLRHVGIVDGEVLIEGMTDRSARLVDLLEASPLFASVRYASPVTRERGGQVERFSFSLTLIKR